MSNDTIIFRGTRPGTDGHVTWTRNGRTHRLTPTESRRVRDHSPEGFNWGYGGSGPAQLALAILLKVFPPKESPKGATLYQRFKSEFVAGWGDEWEITSDDIIVWAAATLPEFPDIPF